MCDASLGFGERRRLWSMNPSHDEGLFPRWIAGDDTVASELLGCQRARLLRFFKRRVPQLADDLTQQTLLACIRGRARMSPQTPFSAYVMVTARRLLWRERTSQAKTVAADVELLCDEISNTDPSDRERVRRAMDRLGTRHREILKGYYVDGRTGPELADTLRLTEPAVRSRLRRALVALRIEFERSSAAHTYTCDAKPDQTSVS